MPCRFFKGAKMLFSSIPFLFYFLPIVLLLYAITPRKFKNFTLLVCSLVFYAWGEPRLVVLLLLTVFCGFPKRKVNGIGHANDAADHFTTSSKTRHASSGVLM